MSRSNSIFCMLRKSVPVLTLFAIIFAVSLFESDTVSASANKQRSGGPSAEAVFQAVPSTLGNIPDSTSSGPQAPGLPLDVQFVVSGISGSPTKVEVSLTINHSYVGDLVAVLIAPDNTTHDLFGYTRALASTDFGDGSNLQGTYVFKDSASNPPSGGWWQEAAAQGADQNLTAGDYRSTERGGLSGTVDPRPPTSINLAFAGVANANGTWILRITDGAQLDIGSVSAASLTIEGKVAQTGKANVDLNGDGTTDWAIVREQVSTLESTVADNRFPRSYRDRLKRETEGRPEGGTIPVLWWTRTTDTGVENVTFHGSADDFFTPSDFDGDGKADLAVWRPGAPNSAHFKILKSSTMTIENVTLGQFGDDPAIVGDYDGDGKSDPAVFRCPVSAGQCTFFYKGSNNNPQGNITFMPWGSGTIDTVFASPGDFDGDGKFDFNVQTDGGGCSGLFALFKSQSMTSEFVPWGRCDDFIAPGDYDGDGRFDFAVVRDEAGQLVWYILERDGGMVFGFPWGLTDEDFITPGDFDGDGKQDIAVWRPSGDPTMNFFWVRRSSNGQTLNFEWGQILDYPVANWFVH